MYSKSETALLKKEFWTSFGQYMRPVANAEGEYINWINYKTGIRHLYFRMDATKNFASVGIELTDPDAALRIRIFDQLLSLKNMLEEAVHEKWHWEKDFVDEQQITISRIYTNLPGVNILNKGEWPAIISFLKPRIIALDEFWSMVKTHFE